MTENLRYDLRGLYNAGKRGVGSRNDGSTFEMTDANLVNGVGYYTNTTNAYNYVLNPNTVSLNVTKYSYTGDTTGIEYYYSWTAATAGQGSQSKTSGTVNGSICPAGWRLPTNYTDATSQNISWSALTNAYLGIINNSSTSAGYQILEQQPINFYRAGVASSGSQSINTLGGYWSGTVYDSDFTYYLNYYTSSVNPQNYFNKFIGVQIRCLANRS